MATILNLSTTDFDRPIVRIDGVDYEMRSMDELSVPALKKLGRLGNSMADVEDIEEVDRRLNESLGLIMVDIPVEVVEKLSLMHKRRIIEAFMQEAGQQPTNSPGQLPASSDSTAAG